SIAAMFVHREPVRFRDLDPMGHVNNAVFLTYIESARVAFLQHLGTVEEVDVTVEATRFGEKSFDLAHELRVGDTVVAEAETVLVTYDYERREPVSIPDEWREKLAA